MDGCDVVIFGLFWKMSYENMGLCNGRRREQCTGFVMAESKREKQRSFWRREKKNGEKRRNVGPVTVINWEPRELSPELNSNLAWNHIKFKLGFQSSLKSRVPNIFFFFVRPGDYGFEFQNQDSNHVYQTRNRDAVAKEESTSKCLSYVNHDSYMLEKGSK